MSITLNGGKAAARAEIDAQFGPIDTNLQPAEKTYIDAARDRIAFCIASAPVYVTSDGQVNPGIAVETTGTATEQTGETIAPGVIS